MRHVHDAELGVTDLSHTRWWVTAMGGDAPDMGKGKRLRRQRTTAGTVTATPVAAADYPFVVDTITASALGRDGLAVLAANLWPKDCQT
jgi:hypothetical protein